MYNLEYLEELLELEGFVGLFTILSSFSSFLTLALFVLMGIGLYSMAKKMEISNAWLSFIPVVNIYALGRIAQRYVKRDGTNSAKFSVILLVLYIIEIILLIVFFVFFIIALISMLSFARESIVNDTAMDISMFSSFIPVIILYFVLLVAAIIYQVIYYVALWRVFSIFSNANATLFTVLSVFFNFLPAIFLFAIRNKEPKLTYGARLGFEENL